MKTFLWVPLFALAACAAPRAAENPDSVPNILLDITQTRAAPTPYIYINGGIYDGAAVGQTANFVVTPDDTVVCTFQTDPVLPIDGPEITVTAHRLNMPGIYADFAAIFLPNTAPTDVVVTNNFAVETGGPTTVSTVTGPTDPRFERMTNLFFARPSPCWLFG